MSRHLSRWILAVLAVAAILAFVDLVVVHQETGDVRLWPAATPSRIHFRERDYLLSPSTEPAEPAATPAGHAFGGGTIVALPSGENVPTVIWLEKSGATHEYALSGGP